MLEEIKARLERACLRVGRDPAEVRLIAVTKGQDVSTIQKEVLEKDHRVLGENRVQEWRQKAARLENVEWHLIGNLQTNKVKYCQGFTLLHSLNSRRLADALNAFGVKKDHVFNVLLEVNVAAEASKQGVLLEDASDLADYVRTLSHVKLLGLMTMAPYSKDPEASRPVFRELNELRDTLKLRELSMGMSGDFEVAIEEGATMVRVGSAIFREAIDREA